MRVEKIVVPTENTRALFSTLPDTDLSLIGALCERHYQQLYRQVHAPSPCAGCQKHDIVTQGIAPMLLQLQTTGDR